jgi:hypothetical protein
MNSILVIKPYWFEGTWVFDDDSVGLIREPFVAGVPEMIDLLVSEIPNARDGFRLLFSANAFPGYQAKFQRDRGEVNGTWYRTTPPFPPMEGWLCPALFKYFDEAPQALFVKAEATRD